MAFPPNSTSSNSTSTSQGSASSGESSGDYRTQKDGVTGKYADPVPAGMADNVLPKGEDKMPYSNLR
jgi:hypothetical protein